MRVVPALLLLGCQLTDLSLESWTAVLAELLSKVRLNTTNVLDKVEHRLLDADLILIDTSTQARVGNHGPCRVPHRVPLPSLTAQRRAVPDSFRDPLRATAPIFATLHAVQLHTLSSPRVINFHQSVFPPTPPLPLHSHAPHASPVADWDLRGYHPVWPNSVDLGGDAMMKVQQWVFFTTHVRSCAPKSHALSSR